MDDFREEFDKIMLLKSTMSPVLPGVALALHYQELRQRINPEHVPRLKNPLGESDLIKFDKNE